MNLIPSIFRRRRIPAVDKPVPTVIAPNRVAYWYLTRHNPVRDLTPETLVSAMDAYFRGEVRRLSLIMERIEDVDDVLKVVASKAKKQPATRGWEIIAEDKGQEAQDHKEALENFYNRITVTNAIDTDQVGEVSLLLNQMMDAKSKGYACHEIMWRPGIDHLTAEFRFVPLWFFERKQGRLRFLEDDYAIDGVDLEPGRWLITHGDGLMRACCIAYLYKQMPLKDWLIYCGRHGMPGILGKTHAAYDSPEWKAMEGAVEQMGSEWSGVTSSQDDIVPIDLSAQGELPHPKIIERMDRTMAALWRGADLSTISSGDGAQGSGASLQGDETELIAAADSNAISDTLRRTIDRPVIKWCCGSSRPKAYFAIKGVTKDTTDQDLKMLDQLWQMGFPISQETIASRLSISLPDDDETLLPPPTQSAPLSTPYSQPSTSSFSRAANAAPDPAAAGQYNAAARMQLAASVQADVEPLAKILNDIYVLSDSEAWEPERIVKRLEAFRADLPRLQKEQNLNPDAVNAYADLIGTAIANAIDDTETETGAGAPSPRTTETK